MKNITSNFFLLTLFITIIFLPVASFKLVKVNKPNILSQSDTNVEYLQETIKNQLKQIKKLNNEIEILNNKIYELSEQNKTISNLLPNIDKPSTQNKLNLQNNNNQDITQNENQNTIKIKQNPDELQL